MPELDPDVVRFVGLVLLGLIVIVMLLLLSAVSRSRKEITRALEELRSAGPPQLEAATEPVAAPEPELAPEHVAQEPAAVSPGPGVEPAREAVREEAAPVVSEPEPGAREPEPVAQEAVPPAEQPAVAAATAATQPAEEPAAAGVSEEPQEQPFERDGRWWFRRGDELLVYDEASGQWIPGPQEAAPAAAPQPAQAMATTISSVSGATQVTQHAPETQAEVEATAFWKCPSCGAVNGSTATACRMCFAARP